MNNDRFYNYIILSALVGFVLLIMTVVLWHHAQLNQQYIGGVSVYHIFHPYNVLWLGFSVTFLISFLFYLLAKLHYRQLKLLHQKDEIELIYQITLMAQTKNDKESWFSSILEVICSKKNWFVGHVYEHSKIQTTQLHSTNIWYVADHLNIEPLQQASRDLEITIGVGLPGMVWQKKQSLWSKNIHTYMHCLRAKACAALNLHSSIGIPIIVDNQLEFVLEFFMEADQSFSTEQVKTLDILSNEISQLWHSIVREKQIRRKELRYNALIESAEEQNRLILSAAAEGIYGLDTEGKVTFVNPAAEKMLGYNTQELLGQPMHGIIQHSYENGEPYPQSKCPTYAAFHEGVSTHVNGEVLWRKDGSCFPVSYSSRPIFKQGNIVGAVVTFSDIYEQITAKRNLEKLALYDHLTGLYNRAYFEQCLAKSVKRADRVQSAFALLYLDLDNFKDINDSFGHHYGDLLLKEVAIRIKTVLREIDTIGRLGGDEFGVILEQIHSQDNAEMVANKIIKVVANKYSLKDHEFIIHSSIGIAYYPQSSRDTYELAKFADIAMYRAKEKGRNQCQSYTKELFHKNVRRMRFEQALRSAVDNEEFSLVYQPLYHLPDLQIRSIETLIRWKNPQLGEVPPSEFIKVAEDLGEICHIGLWVCEQACNQCEELLSISGLPLTVAINVSAKQFSDPQHMQQLQRVIERAKLPTNHLVLEMTETAFMELSENSLANIKKMADMGCHIVIDDFGVDYSSFNRLAELPLSALKIDAEFIRKLEYNDKSQKIICLLIHLAKELGFVTVAEGVETKTQLDFLISSGCDFVQGFYLSKPLPLPDLKQLLVSQREQLSMQKPH